MWKPLGVNRVDRFALIKLIGNVRCPVNRKEPQLRLSLRHAHFESLNRNSFCRNVAG